MMKRSMATQSIMPKEALAEQHRKMAQPGGASKN